MLIELSIVAALIILNGVLAMSELAIVSASGFRLKILADQGKSGAVKALSLAGDPGRFLSTVQIGITLVGVLSGAFSGATLGYRLSKTLQESGVEKELAEFLGVGGVVVLITYLSLVVGELVPKQLALRSPEKIACRLAPPMYLLSQIAAPLVWILDTSGDVVLRLLGSSPSAASTVTEDEIRAIIAEGERAGVLKSAERDMLNGVMRLADRAARALMTPRREVEVVDLRLPVDDLVAQLRATKRSRLPARDGGDDAVIGVMPVKAALDAIDAGEFADPRSLVEEAPVVMDTASAISVINQLRSSRRHMALVFDEHGHFEGIITAMDVLESITGSFPDEHDDGPAFSVRSDGSYLVAGQMPVDEFFDRLGLQQTADRSYSTVGGLVLKLLGHLPEPAESVEYQGWTLEVVDLDKTRIDKILVQRAPGAEDK